MAKYIVNPIEVRMHESEKGSIYQSIVAMGFRSRQINDDIKNEIKMRMSDVLTTGDENDPNYDQISISKEFDKYPKPTFLAMKEIEDGKMTFKLPEENE